MKKKALFKPLSGSVAVEAIVVAFLVEVLPVCDEYRLKPLYTPFVTIVTRFTLHSEHSKHSVSLCVKVHCKVLSLPPLLCRQALGHLFFPQYGVNWLVLSLVFLVFPAAHGRRRAIRQTQSIFMYSQTPYCMSPFAASLHPKMTQKLESQHDLQVYQSYSG